MTARDVDGSSASAISTSGAFRSASSPFVCQGREPRMHSSVEAIFIFHGPQLVRSGRCGHVRRFKRSTLAFCFEGGRELFPVPALADCVIAQPRNENLRVVVGRLAEAGKGTNLGAIPLRRDNCSAFDGARRLISKMETNVCTSSKSFSKGKAQDRKIESYWAAALATAASSAIARRWLEPMSAGPRRRPNRNLCASAAWTFQLAGL